MFSNYLVIFFSVSSTLNLQLRKKYKIERRSLRAFIWGFFCRKCWIWFNASSAINSLSPKCSSANIFALSSNEHFDIAKDYQKIRYSQLLFVSPEQRLIMTERKTEATISSKSYWTSLCYAHCAQFLSAGECVIANEDCLTLLRDVAYVLIRVSTKCHLCVCGLRFDLQNRKLSHPQWKALHNSRTWYKYKVFDRFFFEWPRAFWLVFVATYEQVLGVQAADQSGRTCSVFNCWFTSVETSVSLNC